jgi:hypothetical protein
MASKLLNRIQVNELRRMMSAFCDSFYQRRQVGVVRDSAFIYAAASVLPEAKARVVVLNVYLLPLYHYLQKTLFEQ